MSFLSPLPSPHLKCLHIQHFGLDRVTRTPCLTRCSLCLCYLLLPRRMGSPPPLRFLLCSDQDVPGRIWVMRLVQRVPRWDPPSPSLQLLSAWFKLEGQRLEEGKNGHRTKQKYICQYFPKCDSFTSIFSEAAFLNTFQEFLHRFLAF